MFNYKKGVLKLVVHSADISRDTEAYGKMDPFVTICWKSGGKDNKVKTYTV